MHSTVLLTLNVDCAASSTKDKQLYVVPMSALSYTFHKLTLPINFASYHCTVTVV